MNQSRVMESLKSLVVLFYKRGVAVFAAALSLAFFAGCATEGPNALMAHNVLGSERSNNAVVLDRSMMPTWWEKLWNEGKLSFENPQFRRLNGGVISRVTAELRNRSGERDIEVELSTSFRNGSGVVVDESEWQKFKLTPNQTLAYKVNSLVPAENYCIRVRAPRKDTNDISGPGLRLMADLMLRSIMSHYKAIQGKDSAVPRVTLHQFDNRTNIKVDESIFLAKLRAECNSEIPERFRFVSRRSDILDAVRDERRQKREGDLSVNDKRMKRTLSGVDYFLTGALRELSGANYYLFTYQFIDAENSDILWEDQFEVGNY